MRLLQYLAKVFENDDKSTGARVAYLWAPGFISAGALIGSIGFDLAQPGRHATGLTGSIITILGAWSGYGGSVRMWISPAPGIKRGVRDVPYAKVGFLLIAAGTLVWAFGDAALSWLRSGCSP